jgi:phosphatidylglycerol:prolipoprotein diacylglycerol transferase
VLLPHLTNPTLPIYGPLKISLVHVLIIAAVIIGCELGFRRARATGLDTEIMIKGSMWAIGTGFVVSHWTAEILYFPQMTVENPLSLLMIWAGLSSFGGFFGGVMGALLFLRKRGVSPIPYLEAGFFGFVPVWILGRLSCTIVFDHPGRPTDFFLGMADSAGMVRHNLGLYEMLYTVLLTAVLYGLRNYRPYEGFYLVLIIFLYSPVRLILDILRVTDRRYWGFTPGQYFSVLLLALGVWLLVRGLKKSSQNWRLHQ